MNNVLLIVGLTIGAVILINIGIILAFRKGSKKREKPYKALGQAINIARNPWKKENEQLNELSNLVDTIKETSEQDD